MCEYCLDEWLNSVDLLNGLSLEYFCKHRKEELEVNSPVKSSRKELDNTMPHHPLVEGNDKYAGMDTHTKIKNKLEGDYVKNPDEVKERLDIQNESNRRSMNKNG